jgi:hypothetical protein
MSHVHRWIADRDCTEIGPTVCLRPTHHGGSEHITNADGSMAGGPVEHLAGFILAYDWPGEDERLEGGVNVDPHFADHATWAMTGSLEGGDLTLSPSIQCYLMDGKTPSIHGYVRNGKWESA